MASSISKRGRGEVARSRAVQCMTVSSSSICCWLTGKPKGNVTRLRNGSLNVAVDPDREVAQKNVVYFRETDRELADIEELRSSASVVRVQPAVCDRHRLRRARGRGHEPAENKVFPIRDIGKHFTFFCRGPEWRRRSTPLKRMPMSKPPSGWASCLMRYFCGKPGSARSAAWPSRAECLLHACFLFFAEDTGIFDDGRVLLRGRFTHNPTDRTSPSSD